MADEKKTCFVISPIGGAGSDIRRKADCALKFIIKPAFEQLGFATPKRIDETDEAGQITISIARKIIEADWVVADLSGQNANVFYEIGLRHALQKPIIHIADDLQSLPFDVKTQNTIEYRHDDPNSHEAAQKRIIDQVSSCTGKVSTAFSLAYEQHLAINGKNAANNDDQKSDAMIQKLEQILAATTKKTSSYYLSHVAPLSHDMFLHRENCRGCDPKGRQYVGDFSNVDEARHAAKSKAIGHIYLCNFCT